MLKEFSVNVKALGDAKQSLLLVANMRNISLDMTLHILKNIDMMFDRTACHVEELISMVRGDMYAIRANGLDDVRITPTSLADIRELLEYICAVENGVVHGGGESNAIVDWFVDWQSEPPALSDPVDIKMSQLWSGF